MDTMIKEVERRVIETARFHDDVLKAIDAFANLGRIMRYDQTLYAEFHAAIAQLRSAVYKNQAFALKTCFELVGVGGEQAAQYSRDRMRELFVSNTTGGKRSLLHFLESMNSIPTSWEEDEKQLRKEFEDALSK
jgi:hypothetical protein